MKWLADFMMARGINYFVPHAFSPKAFPDPDCPPHFYADGENPQYRYFNILNDYMNRICSIISGGEHLASVAVLYHAEAEWMSGEYMKTQEPVKILNQNQIEADILPFDILEKAWAEKGDTVLSGGRYKAIIVPFAQGLPDKAIKALADMASGGVTILFVNGFPQHGTTQDMNPASMLGDAGCKVIELDALPEKMTALGARQYSTRSFEPDLKIYPYAKDGCTYFLLFNENIDDVINITLSFEDVRQPYIYDAMKNEAYKSEYTTDSTGVSMAVSVHPYEIQIVVFGDDILENAADKKDDSYDTVEYLNNPWKVSTAEPKEYPVFKEQPDITSIGNLNKPGLLPRFSGTIRYEAEFEADGKGHFMLDLGDVGETAEVFVNGSDCGVRIAPPYSFDIGGKLVCGINKLTVDVTNTLVYKMHDRLSSFQAIAPSGLIGPVSIMRSAKSKKH